MYDEIFFRLVRLIPLTIDLVFYEVSFVGFYVSGVV